MSKNTWLSYRIATLLLVSIFTTECPLHAQTKPNNTVVMACLTIVIGGLFIYGVVKLCKKIPKVDAPVPPPPDTNNPPVNINWTNRFGTNWHGAYPPPNWRPGMPLQNKLDLTSANSPMSSAVEYNRYDFPKPIPFDISAWNAKWWGTNMPYASTGYFNGAWSFKIESATDLKAPQWTTKFQFIVYEADGDTVDPSTGEKAIIATLVNCYRGDYDASTNAVAVYSAFYSSAGLQGAPPSLNYLPVTDDATGEDIINLTDPVRPQEFFRAVGVK